MIQADLPEIRDLALTVTHRCNLSCRHCPVNHGPEDLPLDTALSAVRTVIAGATGEVAIAFQGGEPFLRPDFLITCAREADHQARLKGISVVLAATTNGTRITPDLWGPLGELGFCLSFSIDGVEDVQIRSRGEASAGAWAALARSLETPGIKTSAIVTLTPVTAPHLSETVRALVQAGVPEIHLAPDGFHPWSRAALDSLGRELRRAVEESLDRPRSERPLMLARGRSLQGLQGACSPGCRGIALGTDGVVYGCSQLVAFRRIGDFDADPVLRLLAIGRAEEIGTPALDEGRRRLLSSNWLGDLSGRRSSNRACGECRFHAHCFPCPAISLVLGLPPSLIPDSLCDIFITQLHVIEDMSLIARSPGGEEVVAEQMHRPLIDQG